MTDPTTIHLLTHNHWDREWIFTAKYANRWLPTFFENLFAKLEAEPEYRFVLDGQTLIIEDYLKQLPADEAAARKSDIRRFVASGQLQIGPAYLQPDWGLASGEALVRNLLIGNKMAREYGEVMKAGWLLDNFGQIAQAPQIFEGFGIEGAFVWRGVPFSPDKLKTEFWWEAPNGSRIMGVYLLDSYRNAMVLGMTREIAAERILSHTKTLRRFAATPNVLLMNGYEQVPEPDDVLPILKKVNKQIEPEMRAVQSTPSEFISAVKSFNPDLPSLGGYFYSGRFAPILKGVYSSRSYLNQQNNECQRELERWAEKFNAFAWVYGFDYPEERFEQAWKTLLVNHTHDDLCGCSIDPIAQDMQERFAEVDQMSRVMSSESLRAIIQAIDTASTKAAKTAVVIFNPSSRPRRDVVSFSVEIPETERTFQLRDGDGNTIPYQLISRIGSKADIYVWPTHTIPSVGYRTYYITPGEPEKVEHPRVVVSAKGRTMENKYLHVRINPDGTLTLREKIHDDVYENLGYFEDGGDCGDTYDYSYPAEDRIITSLGNSAEITLEQSGPLMARFRIRHVLKLPRKLTADRTARTTKTRKVEIISFVELSASAGHVEIRTEVNNIVKDHRLRVIFPTGIQTDVSHAGMPYDVAEFPVTEPDEHDVPEEMQDLMLAGRYIAPVQTRPFQHYISLADDERSLSIFSSGLNEYEVLPEDSAIALTLLRGVGWLARADLLTREGDVGPHIFTPEAQSLGKQVFEYAIYPHGSSLEKANPHFESDRTLLKFRAVQTNIHEGHLPDAFSFFSWHNDEVYGALKLTTLKQSEDGRDVIVRFYNAFTYPVKSCLKLGAEVTAAWRTNLNEDIESELPISDGVIPFEIQGKEIMTVRLRVKAPNAIEDYSRHPARVLPQLFPSAEFAPTKMPALLTQKEVDIEVNRARQLGAALEAIQDECKILDASIKRRNSANVSQLALYQRLKGREATLSRMYYEAEISSLLNAQLLVTYQMESRLDEIGEKLNWARVHKRVGEFLIHYYEGLLDEE